MSAKRGVLVATVQRTNPHARAARPWQTPRAIMEARRIKTSAQVDF